LISGEMRTDWPGRPSTFEEWVQALYLQFNNPRQAHSMDFSYSPDQITLRSELSEFIQTEVNPALQDPPDPATFDKALWQKCANAGLLSLGMPKPWSERADTSLLTMVIALEAIGYACNDNGLPFALATQGCTVQQSIVQHGSSEQQSRYLPASVKGELIGSHAMTEPEAGSDSGSIRLHAVKTEGGYRLTGEKKMIGLAPVADYCVLFASANPDAGRWGVTAFLIDTHTSGFKVSAPVKKMGLISAPMGHLKLSDCFVPEENRLGPEGAGAAIAHHSLEMERICILASQTGRMRRQLELSLEHAKTRNLPCSNHPCSNF